MLLSTIRNINLVLLPYNVVILDVSTDFSVFLDCSNVSRRKFIKKSVSETGPIRVKR